MQPGSHEPKQGAWRLAATRTHPLHTHLFRRGRFNATIWCTFFYPVLPIEGFFLLV